MKQYFPSRRSFPRLSRYIDGTGATVAAGRDDKTVVKLVPSSRPGYKFSHRGHFPPRPVTKLCPVVLYGPAPSRKSLPLYNTVPSRRGNYSHCPFPSRPVEIPLFTVPSRHPTLHRSLSLPFRPANKNCPRFNPARCFFPSIPTKNFRYSEISKFHHFF